MPPSRLPFIVFVLSLSFCFCQMALAQDETTTAEADPGEQTQEVPDVPKKVDVQPVARDEEIANRLQDILAATEWFAEPSVEVQDGVVFLTGEASEDNFRSWATDLAQSTQDVAAVVNRMTVKQRSMWDMSPAITETRTLVANAIQTSPLILLGLVVIGLTWLVARLARKLGNWFFANRISNPLLRRVVSQAAVLPVLIAGIYIVLKVSGLTQLAFTVLGGTGLAGLIIGIAFRDIAENFLASILISVQNPFRAGDLIEVGDHLGFVQSVSTRGTLLMTYDGNHVMIPNAIIYKTTVTNYTANPNRRVDFIVGIGYDDSITKAQQVVKQVLDDHPSVLSDPESRVILDELGPSTVNLRVFVWLDALKHNPDTVRSSVMRMVKQSLLREGISLPDEAREVIFPNNVPVRMIESNGASPNGVTVDSSHTTHEDTKVKDELAEEVVSAAEGSLKSDAEQLQRQANRSWNPEEGTNLLTDGDQNLTTAK